MFQEAFQKLDIKETESILGDLNPAFDGAPFDPLETTIMAIDLPFYPGCRLLDVGDYGVMPPIHRYAVSGPGRAVILDFTNAPIYALNKELPVKLTRENIEDYVRFFFGFVRGKKGRFMIVENVDDIRWREDPPPQARKSIGKMITPVSLKDVGADGVFHLQACMIFKDSLFKSDIAVRGDDGHLTLKNEELLIEGIPVVDDTLGQ